MSVKVLRRTFAAPFVVTLALAPVAAADTPPEPAKLERTWTITKDLKKTAKPTDCLAMQTNTPKAGQPAKPCNPPEPTAYACPTNRYGIGEAFTDKDSIKVILRVGITACVIDRPRQTCDPGEMCNPPPPQKIPCPK